MKIVILLFFLKFLAFANPLTLSQMLLVTFQGNKTDDEMVMKIKDEIDRDLLGGVVITKNNIGLKAELRDLVRFIKSKNTIIALDKQSYFSNEDGFLDFVSHRKIADEFDILEAFKYYKQKAIEIKNIGINYVLEPHVNTGDISQKDTFSDQTEIISTYANIFVKAFENVGVQTGLKFFPFDGDRKWDYELLRPFYDLIQAKRAKSIILACFHMEETDAHTLKNIVQSFLINEFKFDELIVADLRTSKENDLGDIAVKLIKAGADMLILEYKNVHEVKDAILQEISTGNITQTRLKKSIDKIFRFKSAFYE